MTVNRCCGQYDNGTTGISSHGHRSLLRRTSPQYPPILHTVCSFPSFLYTIPVVCSFCMQLDFLSCGCTDILIGVGVSSLYKSIKRRNDGFKFTVSQPLLKLLLTLSLSLSLSLVLAVVLHTGRVFCSCVPHCNTGRVVVGHNILAIPNLQTSRCVSHSVLHRFPSSFCFS